MTTRERGLELTKAEIDNKIKHMAKVKEMIDREKEYLQQQRDDVDRAMGELNIKKNKLKNSGNIKEKLKVHKVYLHINGFE